MIDQGTSWIAGNPGTFIAGVSALIAAVSAFFASRTYRRNAKTKRAEFLMQLHEAFFVRETYKPMRNLLDDSSPETEKQLHLAVTRESQELTDFLNFFELVAYFQTSKTLEGEDVEALLGYYLDLLRSKVYLASYIGKSEKSFQHLNRLLGDAK